MGNAVCSMCIVAMGHVTGNASLLVAGDWHCYWQLEDQRKCRPGRA